MVLDTKNDLGVKMGKWTETFESHPIHSKLESVTVLLTSLEEQGLEDFESAENIQRVVQIVSQVSSFLKKVDPILVDPGTIDNLNGILTNVESHLNSFKSTNDKVHINNANEHATRLLVPLSNIIVPIDKLDIKAMRDSVLKYRKSVGQQMRRVDEETNGLKAKIEGLNQAVDQIRTTVEGQKSRLDESVAEFQKQFSQTEEERRKKYSEYELNWNNKYNEFFNSRKAEFENAYQNVLKKLDEQTKHVEKLVGAISLKGHSAGFKQVANEERKAKRIFQFGAVLSLLVLIGVSYLIFKTAIGININWGVLTGKMVLTTAVGILAAYLARQAEKHEEAERKNRKMELELASIETYLVGLPEPSQIKIKELLSDRFFATREPVTIKKRGKVSGNATDLVRFLEELTNIAKKIPLK